MRFLHSVRAVVYLFSVLCFFASCKEELQKEVVSEYPNGKPMVVQGFKYVGDEKLILKQIRNYPNGEPEIEGGLKNGKKHGLWAYYKPDGFKWMEEVYENGELHGEFTVWYRSGDVNYQGEYYKGRPHGEWLFFREDGTKYKRLTYDKGEKVSSTDLN